MSPHLDDVVLGCADLVAAHPGAVVITVTAGKPPPHPLTDWDRQCGFAAEDDVVGARRQEDGAALAVLGARPVWLDFLDRQYANGQSPHGAAIADAIELLLHDAGPRMIASPLGLSHPDHLVTAAASFAIARRLPEVRWVVYEDAIYRAAGGATDEALGRLADDGFVLRPLEVGQTALKRDAIDRYPSQLKGLGELVLDANKPERYWSVVRRA